MLGREVNTQSDLFSPLPRRGDLYVIAATDRPRDSEGRLCTSEERMKRDYDLKVYARAYDKGDLADILDTATVKGKCRKLSPSWKGPGIVIKKLSSYLYRVKTHGGGPVS